MTLKLLTIVLLTAAGAAADTVLIDDLVEAVEPVIKAKPRDAAAYLVLGRAEALGFRNKLEKVELEGKLEPGKVPVLADDAKQPRVGLPVSTAQLTKYLNGAVDHLVKALELSRNDPRARLAMAQMLDAGASSAAEVDGLPRLSGTPPIMNAGQIARTEALIEDLGNEAKRDAAEKELRKHLDESSPIIHAHRAAGSEAAQKLKAALLAEQWREQAIAGYLQVYQMAAKAELGPIQAKRLSTTQSFTGQSLEGYIRLVEQRGPRGAEVQQLPKMKTIHQALLKMSP